MTRLAILNAAKDAVEAVIIGDPAEFPQAKPVPAGLPVSPGTAWVNGAFDVEPLPDPEPAPRELSRMEFVNLVQTAGGMSDEQLVAAHGDTNLAAMWLKLQLAAAVDRDDPNTAAGLGGLEALGYLPNGAAAVIEAWPVVRL